jgi:hypothetical protein
MAFNGKLLELKTNGYYVEFLLKYIKAESYKVTPNQRMEVSANRSASGLLIRNTVAHTASKIDLNTPPLTNKEVGEINSLLNNAYTDATQRKLDLRYYDPTSDSYKTGTFYVPDIDFNILRIDKNTNTIHYDSTRIAFIEY